MTIAIGLVTYEGVVFGCDSTTTVSIQPMVVNASPIVAQLFNSAQKLFEIGPANTQFIPGESFSGMFMTSGEGSFGPISWRDIVNKFYVERACKLHWSASIAESFFDFATSKWADLQASGQIASGEPLPSANVILSCVPARSTDVHAGSIDFDSQNVVDMPRGCIEPLGIPDTISRLILGYDERLKADFVAMGGDETIFDAAASNCNIQPFLEHMPLRDAIDFVHFLVYSTVKMHRYKGGPAMVGGAIEIAALTADRGFRWIMHKPLKESIGVTTNHHFT